MKLNLTAFTVDTLEQAKNVIIENRNYNSNPILHFKSYLIEGFGTDFILTFQNMLILKFGKNNCWPLTLNSEISFCPSSPISQLEKLFAKLYLT